MMIIFYANRVENETAYLTEEESQHCAKVLRKKVGNEVYVTDGAGQLYTGRVGVISKKEVQIVDVRLIESQAQPHKIGIAIAPTKNIDRYEWFLEKCTEIGVTDIYPFLAKRSERKVIKPIRLEKRIVSAMKQSKNLYKPTLQGLVKLSDLLVADYGDINKYIAHCMEPESALQNLYTSGSDAIVLIGPEGDFSKDEVRLAKENGWTEVSLGKSRLRTETAGLVACHLLNL